MPRCAPWRRVRERCVARGGRPRCLGGQRQVAEEREGVAEFALQAGEELGIGAGLRGRIVPLGRRERALGRDADGGGVRADGLT